jgi:hypothetical protein
MEKQTIMRASALYEPVHSVNHVAPGWLLARIGTVIRQKYNIFSLVAMIANKKLAH